MIETKIPEINVSDLMERVRAKAQEIRRVEARPKLPPLGTVPELPAAILPQPVAPKTSAITQATQAARAATTVGRWIPKPLRGLFRRQGRFNHEILRTIESLAHTNAQLADRLRHLSACIQVQDHAIHQLAQLRRADGDWLQNLAVTVVTTTDSFTDTRSEIQREIDVRTQQQNNALATALRRLSGIEAELRDNGRGRLSERFQLLEKQSAEMVASSAALRANLKRVEDHSFGRSGDLERISEHLRNLQNEENALRETSGVARVQLDGVLSEARELRASFERAGEHLRNLQRQVDRIDAETVPLQAQSGLGEAVARLEQRLTDDAVYLKGELSNHRLLLTQLMTPGVLKSTRPRSKQLRVTAGNLDSFYVSFEDRFRGSRVEIKRRLEVYLPSIKNCRAGSAKRPVLDLGCGRGEWLELLKEHTLVCRGVDANAAMHAQCVERGLEVVHSDILEYLRDVPDASFGAVTGFHIIEHLPLEYLLELISQTRRVLTPAGVAIFESPNCKNLVVGACSFYIDPTHRNPIFPETAELMLTLQGFEKIRIEYLSPNSNVAFEAATPELATIKDLFYGPQDFGIIAYKPKVK